MTRAEMWILLLLLAVAMLPVLVAVAVAAWELIQERRTKPAAQRVMPLVRPILKCPACGRLEAHLALEPGSEFAWRMQCAECHHGWWDEGHLAHLEDTTTRMAGSYR